MNSYIIILFLGFILGIFFSVFENSVFFIITPILFSILIFVYLKYFKQKDVVFNLGIFISVFMLAFSFGHMRVYFFEKNIVNNIAEFENKNIEFEGRVFKQSESDGNKQKVYLKITKIKYLNGYKKVSDKVLIFTNLYPKFFYDDVVKGSGKLVAPPLIESGGHYFNYPKYLAKDKITNVIYFGNLEKLKSNNSFFSKIISIKYLFTNSLSVSLKEPESSLISGIIFGSDTLPKEISDLFRSSGLSHITVLSGYNITVLSQFIMRLTSSFVSYSSFVSIFTIFIFIFISGISSTSLRASFMAVIAILAKRFGKSYVAGRALLVVVFLMVLYNPFTLIYDPSFHLSFLATFSIIYISPIVNRKLSLLSNSLIRDVVSTTVSAQIFVLPYIVFMTGQVSTYSFFSNILVLPFVPLSMFLGFWSAILSFFSSILALPISLPLNFILKYFIYIADLFTNLPFSQLNLPNPDGFIIFVFYFCAILFMYHKYDTY